MISDLAATVVTGILFFVTFAWISLFARVLRRNEILAFEPRRATPWGAIAVVLSFFLFIGSQIAVGLAFGVKPDAEPTVAQTNALLTWTAVAILAATLTSIGLIHLSARAGRADFGISLEHVPRDLFVGIYAFLILGPATFLIQFIFVKLLEFESQHPLIELLEQDSTGMLFGVVTVLAVIVAPISEEYFFRVLLQGWLEKIFASWVPIVISAAVFALMHWSHGPDPAALFVLALGLGYLYQRTHRWLPCVVTHACLNGTTMLMLWFGLE